MNISRDLFKNIERLKFLSNDSFDINYKRLDCGRFAGMLVWCEGMAATQKSWETLFKPLTQQSSMGFLRAASLMHHLCSPSSPLVDKQTLYTLDEVFSTAMSGFVVYMLNGANVALAVPAQGYSFRAVSESYTEENIRSSREGFAEPLRINITLVRRRIKNPLLVFEHMTVGTLSNTEVALVYLSDRVNKRVLCNIKKRLAAVSTELVLESGFIQAFLKKRRFSLFSGSGHTERPDSLCGKLLEGRVGILVDGTPFALIVPYLFTENFQSFDDYSCKPYFASFVRILKYSAFFTSILLPGLFVATVNFAPQLLPNTMIATIASSRSTTPMPLMLEALFINLLYEIVREAGLRLPRPIGHAVSLIGALVVGDAAVNAGIATSAMIMTIALTTICSFTIPMLYEPVIILRMLFIIVGGAFGLLGVTALLFVVLSDITSQMTYGIPYTTPLAPASKGIWSDGLLRKSWRMHGGKSETLYEMKGAEYDDED